MLTSEQLSKYPTQVSCSKCTGSANRTEFDMLANHLTRTHGTNVASYRQELPADQPLISYELAFKKSRRSTRHLDVKRKAIDLLAHHGFFTTGEIASIFGMKPTAINSAIAHHKLEAAEVNLIAPTGKGMRKLPSLPVHVSSPEQIVDYLDRLTSDRTRAERTRKFLRYMVDHVANVKRSSGRW